MWSTQAHKLRERSRARAHARANNAARVQSQRCRSLLELKRDTTFTLSIDRQLGIQAIFRLSEM